MTVAGAPAGDPNILDVKVLAVAVAEVREDGDPDLRSLDRRGGAAVALPLVPACGEGANAHSIEGSVHAAGQGLVLIKVVAIHGDDLVDEMATCVLGAKNNCFRNRTALEGADGNVPDGTRGLSG